MTLKFQAQVFRIADIGDYNIRVFRLSGRLEYSNEEVRNV